MIEFARPTTVNFRRCGPAPTVIVEPTENPRPVFSGRKHNLARPRRPVSSFDHEIVEGPTGSGAADEGLRREAHPGARSRHRHLPVGADGGRHFGEMRRPREGRCPDIRSDRRDDVGSALRRERVNERSLRVDDERKRHDRGRCRDQHDERDDAGLQPPPGDPASYGAKGCTAAHPATSCMSRCATPAIRPSTSSIVLLA